MSLTPLLLQSLCSSWQHGTGRFQLPLASSPRLLHACVRPLEEIPPSNLVRTCENDYEPTKEKKEPNLLLSLDAHRPFPVILIICPQLQNGIHSAPCSSMSPQGGSVPSDRLQASVSPQMSARVRRGGQPAS